MESRFGVSREELYNLQMELKQVQYTQANYAERILRLEKRQADDSAIKSVWNSPFPGVLAGTPQHGPVQIPQNDVFDDLDEQGEQLLGSLHLGPAEEEPVRRGGAASRANSVRFDESALHGSSWAAQNNRHSGDFGQVRPSTGFMMERSLSHKSDGRHSSAGHSVHSHHSVASGRASSIGLDTNFATGDEDDDDSSFDMPGLPASVYVLGTVPSIVRCWLTTDYAHGTLLYADICTGSQKSTIEYSLVKELDLLTEFQRDVSGAYKARLDVYLAEAVITRHSSRSDSAAGSVPSMSVCFEMCGGSGGDAAKLSQGSKPVRIFIGSDALRAHAADILFSQNTMVLYSNERDRLRVPFIRPEDEEVFRHITTSSAAPERPKLNANAAPFVFGEINRTESEEKIPPTPTTTTTTTTTTTATTTATPTSITAATKEPGSSETRSQASPATSHSEPSDRVRANSVPDYEEDTEKSTRDASGSERRRRDGSSASEASRREASSGIWGSWRNPNGSGTDQRETGPLSGYQPAPRGRNMKILKAPKSSSSSARTGASYEPPIPSKSELGRRKSQISMSGESTSTAAANGSIKWETKKPGAASEGKGNEAAKPASTSGGRTASGSVSLPRSANNPVGVASAFSWMTPPGTAKSTKTTTAAE
ncbi:hypothetical protein TGAM01_v203622 [Trichoderma gamsii]|uniref:Ubiquitin carboxyl-terminal hydrolase 19 n=1 Tax=Trichoderma gamsii TaxID=398673 RepID=A0A2P4ZSJ6_9HYPO|nr:hypothetical protein TGAM01_v203622 [Trichoderma gamsii]PON27241.1 hypothetical protein TGAM01_v203622 [Trichoderma gamsii]